MNRTTHTLAARHRCDVAGAEDCGWRLTPQGRSAPIHRAGHVQPATRFVVPAVDGDRHHLVVACR